MGVMTIVMGSELACAVIAAADVSGNVGMFAGGGVRWGERLGVER